VKQDPRSEGKRKMQHDEEAHKHGDDPVSCQNEIQMTQEQLLHRCGGVCHEEDD